MAPVPCPRSRGLIVSAPHLLARIPVLRHIGAMQSMSSSGVSAPASPQRADFAVLKRFMPYLWPVGEPRLRARVVGALVLVLIAKSTTLIMPFAFKGAIDRMAGTLILTHFYETNTPAALDAAKNTLLLSAHETRLIEAGP